MLMIRYLPKKTKNPKVNTLARDILIPFFNDLNLCMEFTPTGSMVYGSPNADSDYDFVCDPYTDSNLYKTTNKILTLKGIDVRNIYGSSFNVKFKINTHLFNLIFNRSIDYAIWSATTDKMIKQVPPFNHSRKYYKDMFIDIQESIANQYKILSEI